MNLRRVVNVLSLRFGVFTVRVSEWACGILLFTRGQCSDDLLRTPFSRPKRAQSRLLPPIAVHLQLHQNYTNTRTRLARVL